MQKSGCVRQCTEALWCTHSVERAYVIFPHANVFSLMYSGGTFPQGRKRKAERGVRQWRVLKIEAFFLLAKLTSCIKACTPPRMGLCLWWFKFWLFFPFSFGRKCPKKYYNFWNALLISASCSMWGLSENFLKRFLRIVIFTYLLCIWNWWILCGGEWCVCTCQW